MSATVAALVGVQMALLPLCPAIGSAISFVGPGGGGWIECVCPSRHVSGRLFVGCDVGGFYFSADEGRAYTAQSPDLRFLRGYYAEQWYSRPHNLYFHDPIAAVAIFHPEICTYEPSAVKIDVNDRGISYRTKDPSKWTWQTLRAVDFEKFREIYISVVSR